MFVTFDEKLLKFSTNLRINYSIALIFICELIIFAFTVTAIGVFTLNFPYKKYCFYEEYDDPGIGCVWGSGTHLATTANAIILGCAMFLFGALIFLRDFNASSEPKSVAAAANQQASNPNANLLSEGIVNYNQPQQVPGPYGYQQQYMPDYKEYDRDKKRTNWKVFIIWLVAAAMGLGYSIIISTSMIPNADAHAMGYIMDKWNNAQCFKLNVSEALANEN